MRRDAAGKTLSGLPGTKRHRPAAGATHGCRLFRQQAALPGLVCVGGVRVLQKERGVITMFRPEETWPW